MCGVTVYVTVCVCVCVAACCRRTLSPMDTASVGDDPFTVAAHRLSDGWNMSMLDQLPSTFVTCVPHHPRPPTMTTTATKQVGQGL